MQRTNNPKHAMDYPHVLDDEKWVIWTGNEYKWPDGRRETKFLPSRRTHALHGFYLLTIYPTAAIQFDTKEDAERFFNEQDEMREKSVGHRWGRFEITTVAEMKVRRGYA